MVLSHPFTGSHAHLRSAVARVYWSVQLQLNEVAAEERRSEEEGVPLRPPRLSIIRTINSC